MQSCATGRLAKLGVQNPTPLTWKDRTRALRDAMRGLCFLHEPIAGKREGVIHRDIKPANILLDANLNARLSDVGLCKVLPQRSNTQVLSLAETRLIGTPGYLDPLYQNTGKPSELTDGYAMGITMLVVITGQQELVDGEHVLDRLQDEMEDPARMLPKVHQSAGSWPQEVAVGLTKIAKGLSWERKRGRMPLRQALEKMEHLAEEVTLREFIQASAERSRMCVICMSSPRSVRYQCGHASVCNSCDAALGDRPVPSCPVCRVPIRGRLQGEEIASQNTFVATTVRHPDTNLSLVRT